MSLYDDSPIAGQPKPASPERDLSLEAARARRIQAETESTTISGLQQLVLRGCEAQMALGDRIDEAALNLLAEIPQRAKTLAALNATAVEIVQTQVSFLRQLRDERDQSQPTNGEVACDVFKHAITETSKLWLAAIAGSQAREIASGEQSRNLTSTPALPPTTRDV